MQDEEDAAGIASLVPDVKSGRVRNLFGFDWAEHVNYGRSRLNCSRLIMNISVRSPDLPWLRGGATTDVLNARPCYLLHRLFDRLLLLISSTLLYLRIIGKELYQIRDFDFGVQFSLNLIPTNGGHCAPPPPPQPGTVNQISQERLELRTRNSLTI